MNSIFKIAATACICFLLNSCGTHVQKQKSDTSNTSSAIVGQPLENTIDTTGTKLPLAETYWRLIEAMDKPIKRIAGTREVHIILKQNKTVEGYLGCNTLSGSYLQNGNSLSFKNMISTLMACTDMEVENKLKEALTKADNYTIKGNLLSLQQKGILLAQFEGAPFKN